MVAQVLTVQLIAMMREEAELVLEMRSSMLVEQGLPAAWEGETEEAMVAAFVFYPFSPPPAIYPGNQSSSKMRWLAVRRLASTL